MTTLTAKHATGGDTFGVDGDTGDIVDMKDFGVWDTFQVRPVWVSNPRNL